jgi:hypothetical protein
MPYTSTIDTKGTKTVNIKTTGNDKNRFKVMLAVHALVLLTGKLPPYVIFKRKTLPKEIPERNYCESSRERLDGREN